jgi:hypothetical protein
MQTNLHPISEMLSLGDVSRRYGISFNRLHHVVMSRGIKPAATLGNRRGFAKDQVDAILREVAAIDAARVSRSQL